MAALREYIRTRLGPATALATCSWSTPCPARRPASCAGGRWSIPRPPKTRVDLAVAVSSPITVVIVDDHEIVRRGLVDLLTLDDAFEVVGEAATGAEALQVVRATRPRWCCSTSGCPTAAGCRCAAPWVAARNRPRCSC